MPELGFWFWYFVAGLAFVLTLFRFPLEYNIVLENLMDTIRGKSARRESMSPPDPKLFGSAVGALFIGWPLFVGIFFLLVIFAKFATKFAKQIEEARRRIDEKRKNEGR